MNCANGGLVGRVTAVPIFCTNEAENSVAVLDCFESVDEGDFEALDPDAAVAVAAQPKKFGIVTLTPAQRLELNATASEKELACGSFTPNRKCESYSADPPTSTWLKYSRQEH